MIPIYGFLEKDSIGLLIMANPKDTVNDLINRLQKSAAVRVKPQTSMHLLYKNKLCLPEVTVAEMGMQALDHFFVVKSAHV